jgi:Tol biopolymer transport system component
MFVNRGRARAVILLVPLVLLFGPWAGSARGQYFGRNKVQYENFDFKVLKTEHFDIHYYPEAADAVGQAARMAERWYARLSRLFNHELSGRQTIILYADHADFEQTTVLQGSIDEGTGGATEVFKRRVVLPMAGSLAETDHVLGHELVHAFQFDITSGAHSPVGGGFPAASLMPLWFIEGMAEYLSLGPEYPLTAMIMLDAARQKRLPSFAQLYNTRYNPYRYGHALWAYIGGRWGDPAVAELLKTAASAGDIGFAIANVLEIPPDQLMADWQAAIEAAYEDVVAKTRAAADYGQPVISAQRGGGYYNVGPALSPDGTKLAFLSEKDQYSIEMFLADADSGKVERKLVKTAVDAHFESLQFIYSAGGWHPNNRDLVIAGVSRGKPTITIIDSQRGKRTREFRITEVGEIFNPSWSPDGRHVVFSASVGGLMDLFTLDTETGERRRLTEDAYADMQPVWSPDGRRIAFVSDRFASDLTNLEYGGYDLALLDLESGAIRPVPGFSGASNINPQWSADGSAIYFISDQSGTPNIYRVSLEDGALRQVTAISTGVSGITELSPAISLAREGHRLVFSAYEDNRYTIYSIDSDSILAGGPVEPPLGLVSPAVLPPTDRPVGDVMALVRNADLGLPAAGEHFESVNYKAGLSLDYIAPPTVAVGASSYGTFVGGGTALYWSDLLGEHSLATALQVNGTFKDIAALVSYVNRVSRANWGAVVSQYPLVYRYYGIAIDSAGNYLEQELRQRQTSREASLLLSYPLSRVQRVEFSGGYQNISYENELRTRVYTPSGVLIGDVTTDYPSCEDEPTEPLCAPSALNLGLASAALVYDNTIYGFTGPVLGQRYRLEFAPFFGSLNVLGVLVDYRKYMMPVRNVTLAGRLVHFGRYGSGGEDYRLQPLYLGYQQVVRGYESSSFSGSECVDPVDSKYFVGSENTTCPVYTQLFGSRQLIANLELRMPVPQVFGIRGSANLPPFTLALFFDAGAAWWTTDVARLVGGNYAPWNPVTSYGIAGRINLFGVLLLEVDFVHPNQRPREGWMWQFGFAPGF